MRLALLLAAGILANTPAPIFAQLTNDEIAYAIRCAANADMLSEVASRLHRTIPDVPDVGPSMKKHADLFFEVAYTGPLSQRDHLDQRETIYLLLMSQYQQSEGSYRNRYFGNAIEQYARCGDRLLKTAEREVERLRALHDKLDR